MSKDDYFVIAYRILIYLYACVKSGVNVDMEEISANKLDITQRYWLYVIEHLQADEYIEGVHITKLLGSMPVVMTENIVITPKGIEYLKNNSTMEKAKEFLKTLKEIIPGL